MKKIFMLLAFVCIFGLHTMYAQSLKVSGKVSDETGIPLPGVSVVVKGTTTGGITNIDGVYQVDVPQSSSIIVFSFMGMQTQEVVVNGRSEININLIQSTKGLDEVVVVGYGTQKKANLTGSVSSVKMDEIVGDRPVNTIASAIQGAVPGLELTSGNGHPGSSFNFNIRGTTSINGGSPLVLVDNVPMDLSMINPNDIESISVLKDAASTAIYGARAAFGVVLITTKTAEFNKGISVNYSNNFSFSKPESLPQKASIRESIRVARLMDYDPYYSNYTLDVWEAELDKYEADPSLFPNGISEVDDVFYSVKEYDAFEDLMESHGFRQQHDLGVTGGSEKTSYRLSLGRVDEDGILYSNKDTYLRNNISAYVKTKVKDWFTVELETRYSNSKKTSPVGSAYGLYGLAVIAPSHHPIGISDVYDEPVPYQTSRNYIELDGKERIRKDDLRLFGKTTMNPFKGFNLITEWTYNYKASKKNRYEKKYTTLNGRTFQENISRSHSTLTLINTLEDYKAVNAYASYEFDLSDLNVKVMGGINHEESDYEYLKSKATGMMNNELPSISSGQETPEQEDSYRQFALRGYFFRINFNYADKYLLEVNGRYDGSSRFPRNERFGFFPSVSAGWRVSEESFMEPIKDVLSNLKLRASYGSIGNQNILLKPNVQDYYPYIPVMSAYETKWIVDGERAKSLSVPPLVSNSFTWEEVRTLDFGVDLGLFDNKFSAVFDWYKRETIGMLAPGMELPAVLGASAPKQNVADLESYGWELQLNWNDRIGDDFRYSLGFNIYDSDAKITKFDNESKLLSSYYVGQQLGDIWGYTTGRFYTTDDFETDGITLKEGVAGLPGAEHKPGDILYVDYNNDGKIDNGDNTADNPGDMKIIGNDKRHYQYGITASAGWKNFDLSLFFTGVGKRDLWLEGDLIFPHNSEFGTIYAHQLDYWTPENTNAFHARPRYKKAYNKKKQTRYLSNGAFVRLKNVSLSYKVPKSLLAKVGLNQVRFHIAGENLWTKHHLPEGMNPDMKDGQRGWNYPFMKKISFGVNVSF